MVINPSALCQQLLSVFIAARNTLLLSTGTLNQLTLAPKVNTYYEVRIYLGKT